MPSKDELEAEIAMAQLQRMVKDMQDFFDAGSISGGPPTERMELESVLISFGYPREKVRKMSKATMNEIIQKGELYDEVESWGLLESTIQSGHKSALSNVSNLAYLRPRLDQRVDEISLGSRRVTQAFPASAFYFEMKTESLFVRYERRLRADRKKPSSEFAVLVKEIDGELSLASPSTASIRHIAESCSVMDRVGSACAPVRINEFERRELVRMTVAKKTAPSVEPIRTSVFNPFDFPGRHRAYAKRDAFVTDRNNRIVVVKQTFRVCKEESRRFDTPVVVDNIDPAYPKISIGNDNYDGLLGRIYAPSPHPRVVTYAESGRWEDPVFIAVEKQTYKKKAPSMATKPMTGAVLIADLPKKPKHISSLYFRRINENTFYLPPYAWDMDVVPNMPAIFVDFDGHGNAQITAEQAKILDNMNPPGNSVVPKNAVLIHIKKEKKPASPPSIPTKVKPKGVPKPTVEVKPAPVVYGAKEKRQIKPLVAEKKADGYHLVEGEIVEYVRRLTLQAYVAIANMGVVAFNVVAGNYWFVLMNVIATIAMLLVVHPNNDARLLKNKAVPVLKHSEITNAEAVRTQFFQEAIADYVRDPSDEEFWNDQFRRLSAVTLQPKGDTLEQSRLDRTNYALRAEAMRELPNPAIAKVEPEAEKA